MMKRRFKKSIIALIAIVAMISVTACRRNETAGNNGNNNGSNNGNNAVNDGSNTGDNTPNDATVEEKVGNQANNGDILDRYNTLLKNETNRDNVYAFIDENIENASEAEADQLIGGVLGFEDTYENVDYTRLYAYKNYVSDEVEDYLELMHENEQKPYMNNNEVGVTLDELLDRAEDFEEHIAEFPDGITTQPSYEMYVKLMDTAIRGGYDRENNVASYYQGDAKNRIDGRAVDEYMKFLADEVDDGNNEKVNTNTTNNTANNTNTTANNTTNNTGNSTTNNTTTNNNNSTNNTTTSKNTTVNVGDNSEENFDAPITRSIVKEYVDLLATHNNEITTEVENFYANLNTLIADKFGI